MRTYILHFILLLLLFVFSYQYGLHIKASIQLIMYDILKDFIGYIFIISGAWIAVVHKEDMKKLYSIETKELKRLDGDVHHLFSVFMFSSMILVIIHSIKMASPILKSVIDDPAYISSIKTVSFMLLSLFSYTVLVLLYYSLRPFGIYMLKINDLLREKESNDVKFQGSVKTASKDDGNDK